MFGDLAALVAHFSEVYRGALESLHRRGARATLEVLLREDGA